MKLNSNFTEFENVNVTNNGISVVTDWNLGDLVYAKRLGKIVIVSAIATATKNISKWTTFLTLSAKPICYQQLYLYDYTNNKTIYAQLETNGDIQSNNDIANGTVLRFSFIYFTN